MTFISKAPKFPRVYESVIREQGRVGPGSYNPDKFLQASSTVNARNSHSIFISKTNRSEQFHACRNGSQVGPGEYDPRVGYSKMLNRKLSHGCQSSFKSSIERFPLPKDKPVEANKFEKEQIYIQLLDEEKKKKRLYKFNEIPKQKGKLGDGSNSIPSIPTNEQSYGYRVDKKTNKLVQNQNPNVLLAKSTFSQGHLGSSDYSAGPGAYFLKDGFKRAKGPTWKKDTQREDEYLLRKQREQQLRMQSQMLRWQQEINQSKNKKWEEKGNVIVTKQSRFQSQKSSDRRKQLLMNNLKKQFQHYINNGEDIEQTITEGLKQKQKILEKRMHSESDGSKIECFLSRSARFENSNSFFLNQKNKGHAMDLNISKNQSQLREPSPDEEKSLIKKDVDVPFGSKSNRFQSNCDLNNNKFIGPGSYDNPLSSLSPKKGYSWSIQQEERFKEQPVIDAPGPGYYDSKYPSEKKSLSQTKQGLQWRNLSHPIRSNITRKQSKQIVNETCQLIYPKQDKENPKEAKMKKQSEASKIISEHKLIQEIKNVIEKY